MWRTWLKSTMSRAVPSSPAFPASEGGLLGYVPLFDSLVTGTLCGKWPDIGLWPIVLAMADRNGNLDVTPDYIAVVTGLAVDEVVSCMQRFCEPDPKSRTETCDGRRLELIDPSRNWGWHVVNHSKYREKARKLAFDAHRTATGEDAARKQAERQRRVPPSPALSRDLPLSDSNSDSNKEKNKSAGNGSHRESLGIKVHDSLPLATWEEWLAYRRERRFPMTEVTLKKQLTMLSKYDTETQQAIIDNAIQAGWQGLWPLKGAPKKTPAKSNWRPPPDDPDVQH